MHSSSMIKTILHETKSAPENSLDSQSPMDWLFTKLIELNQCANTNPTCFKYKTHITNLSNDFEDCLHLEVTLEKLELLYKEVKSKEIASHELYRKLKLLLETAYQFLQKNDLLTEDQFENKLEFIFPFSEEKSPLAVSKNQIKTGKPILVLAGDQACEFDQFKKLGMKDSEQSKFYLVNIGAHAKPDLLADFHTPLNLADNQFDIAMMSGVPFSPENVKAFQNAYRTLKDSGIFLYFTGGGCGDEIYKAMLSVFDHVYYSFPAHSSYGITNFDNFKLYNGRYKAEHSQTTFGGFLIAFKGPAKKLQDIYKEHPNFKYVIHYIFFKHCSNNVDKNFPALLSAIEEGMGMSNDEKKPDSAFEAQVAMKVLNYNVRMVFLDLEGTSFKKLQQVLQNDIKEKKDLDNTINLILNLEKLTAVVNEVDLEKNMISCQKLAETQNPALKNAVLNFIERFVQFRYQERTSQQFQKFTI